MLNTCASCNDLNVTHVCMYVCVCVCMYVCVCVCVCVDRHLVPHPADCVQGRGDICGRLESDGI